MYPMCQSLIGHVWDAKLSKYGMLRRWWSYSGSIQWTAAIALNAQTFKRSKSVLSSGDKDVDWVIEKLQLRDFPFISALVKKKKKKKSDKSKINFFCDQTSVSNLCPLVYSYWLNFLKGSVFALLSKLFENGNSLICISDH